MKSKIFGCGLDDEFQLNIHPDAISREGFPIVKGLSSIGFSSSHLLKISAGEYHTIYLFDNGQAFATGSDLNFRIGGPIRAKYNLLTLMNINNEKIIDVHCGRQYTSYLTISGNIVICSSKCVGRQIVVRLNKKVMRLSGNDDAPCAIDESGSIFLFDNDPHKMPKKYCLKKVRRYTSSHCNSPRDSPLIGKSNDQSCLDIFNNLSSPPKRSRSRSVSRSQQRPISKEQHFYYSLKPKKDKIDENKDINNEDDESPRVITKYIEAVDIARGSRFTLVLAKDGKVYGKGQVVSRFHYNDNQSHLSNSSEIQCNHFALRSPYSSPIKNLQQFSQQKRKRKHRSSFEPVESLKGKKCCRVFANQNHAAVLTHDGEVFMWGDGSAGQLGNRTKENNEDFEHLKIGNDKRVKSVSLGLWHSVFVTDDGEVYSTGENTCGQACIGEKSRLLEPTYIETINQKVIDVSCGTYNTFLICERK